MEAYGQEENSLVESFKTGQGPQRAVEPVMMMINEENFLLYEIQRITYVFQIIILLLYEDLKNHKHNVHAYFHLKCFKKLFH